MCSHRNRDSKRGQMSRFNDLKTENEQNGYSAGNVL